jgi:hypothetical protein
MVDLYQYHVIEVDSPGDYKITFNIGYDEKKEEYFLPSFSINRIADPFGLYYDNPIYLKDLYLEFKDESSSKVKQLKQDIRKCNLEVTEKILDEICAILEAAYKQGFLKEVIIKNNIAYIN